MATPRLEQRPYCAARTDGTACFARGERTGKSLSALRRDQSATGQWRWRRSQLDTAVRFSIVANRMPSPARHADTHLLATDAWRAGQRFCDRILYRRTSNRARRRSGRVTAASFVGFAGAGCDPLRRDTRELEAGQTNRPRLRNRL